MSWSAAVCSVKCAKQDMQDSREDLEDSREALEIVRLVVTEPKPEHGKDKVRMHKMEKES